MWPSHRIHKHSHWSIRISLSFSTVRTEYGTEADVAGFVGDALFDVIGIAEVLVRGSKTERERGLFSGNPDILVIRSSEGWDSCDCC